MSKKLLKWVLPPLALLVILACMLLSRRAAKDTLDPPQAEPSPTAAVASPINVPSPEPLPTLAEQATGLEISELMPANRSFLPDEDGMAHDWIELTNSGTAQIRLKGLCLSDSRKHDPFFALPDRVLAPGERYLVFCGTKDGAPFSLKRSGETICLYAEDGSVIQSVSYEEAEQDCSVCFEAGQPYSLPYATPGFPNTEQGYEDYLLQSDRHGPLVINELVSYNTDFSEFGNQRGKTFDWVELRNVSDEPLSLEDYYISDKKDEPFRAQLPARTLEPGACFLVYCSGNSAWSTGTYFHVDFSLHVGERVYLRHRDQGLSDSAPLLLMPGAGSFGRMDGEPGFFYFETRSPGKVNPTGYRHVSSAPSPSCPQGIYEGTDSLDLRLDAPGEVHFTLDGSIPTRQSPVFQEDFSFSKTTIIRAIAYEEGKLPSPCLTLSYIINEGHSLPVVSVVCDGKDFHDLNTYTSESRLQFPANAVFFEGPGEDPLFESGCSLTLHGASSRHFEKKSYKLIFRSRFGGDVTCDAFAHGSEQSYRSLLLRAGTVAHMYVVKDSLASLTALAVLDEPLTLDSRYCIVYFNGEYYGIYALREDYTKHYAEQHTGSTPGQVQVQKNRGTDVHAEIYEYLKQHSVAQDEAYDAFCETFDVDAFASWLGIEAYFNNADPDGNIRYIRGDGTGWKWTAALFDLDLSIGHKYASYEYFFSENSELSYITARLIANRKFKEALLRNAAALYHRGLGSELTRGILKDMTEELDPEMYRNCIRWAEDPDIWEIGKTNLYNRLGPQRTLSWIRSLQKIVRASDDEITYWFGDLTELESGG